MPKNSNMQHLYFKPVPTQVLQFKKCIASWIDFSYFASKAPKGHTIRTLESSSRNVAPIPNALCERARFALLQLERGTELGSFVPKAEAPRGERVSLSDLFTSGLRWAVNYC
jgi:hypothetical protein